MSVAQSNFSRLNCGILRYVDFQKPWLLKTAEDTIDISLPYKTSLYFLNSKPSVRSLINRRVSVSYTLSKTTNSNIRLAYERDSLELKPDSFDDNNEREARVNLLAELDKFLRLLSGQRICLYICHDPFSITIQADNPWNLLDIKKAFADILINDYDTQPFLY